MAALGVLAAHFVYELIVVVVDLELLEFLSEAATVEDCGLTNAADVFLLHKHLDLRPICGAQADVQVPKREVRSEILTIFAGDFPWPVRSRN